MSSIATPLGKILAILCLLSCAREPEFRAPKLGERLSIAPIAINTLLPKSAPAGKGVKLNIMWGGRPLSADQGEQTVNFLDQEGKIKLSYKWSELTSAYRSTGCSNAQIATLDGYLQGAALVCDGSIDLNQISRIEVINEKGQKRTATSWSVYHIRDDVLGVSIGLYS